MLSEDDVPESNDLSCFDARRLNLFGYDVCNSIYGGAGWPWTWDYSFPAEQLYSRAAHAHKCLFAILYGLPISINVVANDHGNECNRGILDIVTICAYAHYYGCLHRVAPFFIDCLLSLPNFWKILSKQPDK